MPRWQRVFEFSVHGFSRPDFHTSHKHNWHNCQFLVSLHFATSMSWMWSRKSQYQDCCVWNLRAIWSGSGANTRLISFGFSYPAFLSSSLLPNLPFSSSDQICLLHAEATSLRNWLQWFSETWEYCLLESDLHLQQLDKHSWTLFLVLLCNMRMLRAASVSLHFLSKSLPFDRFVWNFHKIPQFVPFCCFWIVFLVLVVLYPLSIAFQWAWICHSEEIIWK